MICVRCKDTSCEDCYNDYAHCNKYACEGLDKKYGQVIDENGFPTGECDLCKDENCLSCRQNRDYCDPYSCADGYRVFNKTCEKCMARNCKQCEKGFLSCSSCPYGYRLDNDDKCINTFSDDCNDMCEECEYDSDNKPSCKKCKDYYVLTKIEDSIYNTCTPCLADNCKVCEDFQPNICRVCENGYGPFHDGTKEVCRKCSMEECLDCSKAWDKCEYTVHGTNYCPEHCESCLFSPNKCDPNRCEQGYGVNEEGQCEKGNLPFCDLYGKVNECKYCDSGFGISIIGSCIQCGGGCSECHLGYKFCSECNQEGYGPIYTGKCQKCANFCLKCDQFYHQYCEICEEGFGPEVGYSIDGAVDFSQQCNHCIDNCKSCSKSSNLCDECYPGFGPMITTTFFDFYRIECVPCPENCQTCSHDHKECISCNENYGLVSSKCERCKKNCLSCDGDVNFCTSCLEGYGLVVINGQSTGECQRCSNKKCLSCDNDANNCHKCQDGYYLNSGNCELCPINCKTCQNSNKCDECLSGYYLDDEGECVACLENCSKCNSKGCIRCKDGYVSSIYNMGEYMYSCDECPKNCQFCTPYSRSCIRCFEGYCLSPNSDDANKMICLPCPDGCYVKFCKECSQESGLECSICYEGYELDANKKCIEIEDHPIITNSNASDTSIVELKKNILILLFFFFFHFINYYYYYFICKKILILRFSLYIRKISQGC